MSETPSRRLTYLPSIDSPLQWHDLPSIHDLGAFLIEASPAIPLDKEFLPCWSPAEFAREGVYPSSAGTVYVHAFVADLDALDEAQIDQALSAVKWRAHVYTTASHGTPAKQGKACLRIVLPFATPVPKDQWGDAWKRCAYVFGKLADPKCQPPPHRYYVPGHGVAVDTIEGDLLDPTRLPPPPIEWLAWLATAAKKKPKAAQLKPGNTDDRDVLTEGVRIERQRLLDYAKTKKQSQKEWLKFGAGVLKSIAQGVAYALPGARNEALLAAARVAVWEWPDLDVGHFTAHVVPCHQAMYTGHELEEGPKKTTEFRRLLQWWKENGPRSPNGMPDESKVTVELEPTEIERDPYIIQYGGAWYARTQDRNYSRAYNKEEAGSAMGEVLRYEPSIAFYRPGAPGQPPAEKSLRRLVDEYGTVAEGLEMSLVAQRHNWDPERKVLTLATAPLRTDLEPEYSASVEEWLHALAPDEQRYTDLLWWIKYVTDLSRTCAAMCIVGSDSVGKQLFADGMANLWSTERPTPATHALDTFNKRMTEVPLVFADERLPVVHGTRYPDLDRMRELIGNTSHELKVKYRDATSIKGCVRVVVGANNMRFLDTDQDQSPADVEAIAKRFYILPVGKEAQPIAEAWSGEWVATQAIPRHALWIRETFAVGEAPPDKRFIIRDGARLAVRNLSVMSGMRSWICQVVIGVFHNVVSRKKLGAAAAPTTPGLSVQLGSDTSGETGAQVFVMPNELRKLWGTYTDRPAPSVSAITRAIEDMSTGRRIDEKIEIRLDLLREWAYTTGTLSSDGIAEAVRMLANTNTTQGQVIWLRNKTSA